MTTTSSSISPQFTTSVPYYRKLKIIQTFDTGKHAKLVAIVHSAKDRGQIFKKAYHLEHRNIFLHEVWALQKLQKCKFVPRLLQVDDDKRTLYLSHCGKPLQNLGPYRHKIKKYQNIMESQHGVYHNDIREGNVLIKSGQIFFIDFGWARPTKGIAGYGRGKIGALESPKPPQPLPSTKAPSPSPYALQLLLNIHQSNELKSQTLIDRLEKVLQHHNLIKPSTPSQTEPIEKEEDNASLSGGETGINNGSISNLEIE